jgi:hypothetical protein
MDGPGFDAHGHAIVSADSTEVLVNVEQLEHTKRLRGWEVPQDTSQPAETYEELAPSMTSSNWSRYQTC